MTKRFALELGPHNITVNAVAPGFVRTDLTERGRGAVDWQATEETFAAKAMMGRIGEPEDYIVFVPIGGHRSITMISRRAMIAGGALALAGSASPARRKPPTSRSCHRVCRMASTIRRPRGPARQKPLIKLSYRPPNYETPLSYFTSAFTANDSFFVRYHLAGIPEEIDAAQWKLTVGGEGAGPAA